jgi:hypothetical protein
MKTFDLYKKGDEIEVRRKYCCHCKPGKGIIVSLPNGINKKRYAVVLYEHPTLRWTCCDKCTVIKCP